MAGTNKTDERFPRGTKKNPYTSRNSKPEDRFYKYVLCDECGQVDIMTPANDYYDCDDGQTRCEPCLMDYARNVKGCRDFVEVGPDKPDQEPN
jgi:hypothetical protein